MRNIIQKFKECPMSGTQVGIKKKYIYIFTRLKWRQLCKNICLFGLELGDYLSIPKLQRLHRWSLGMDK